MRLNRRGLFACLSMLMLVMFGLVVSASPSGLGYVGVHSPGQNPLDFTRAVSISPDDTLVAASTDRYIVINNLSDGEVVKIIELADAATVLEFTPDGSHLVAGMLSTSPRGIAVMVFETDTWLSVGSDFTNGMNPSSMVISKTGDSMLIPDQHKGAFELSLPDLSIIGQFDDEHDDSVLCVDYDDDEDVAMTADVDGEIILWDLSDHSRISGFAIDSDPVVDCSFSPDGTYLTFIEGDGALQSYTRQGELISGSTIEFLEAAELQWSDDGSNIFILETNHLSSVVKVKTDGWTEVEATMMGHKALDFDLSSDEQTMVVSTGTIHTAIYRSQFIAPGMGEDGADFDGDGIPDHLDDDDDGDSITDTYDIHCSSDNCKLDPDPASIRHVGFEIEGDSLIVRDTVTFTRYESSALRNLTSTLLVDDNRIEPEELTWMKQAMCDNINSREIVEQWRGQIILEGGELGDGVMDCDSVGGISTAKLDDYSIRATLTWTTTFQLKGVPTAPYNITIKGLLEPPAGSSAIIAPQYPARLTFEDADAVDNSIDIWNKNQTMMSVLMDAIPPDDPGIDEILSVFFKVNMWIPISTFLGILVCGGIILKQKQMIATALNDPSMDMDEDDDEDKESVAEMADDDWQEDPDEWQEDVDQAGGQDDEVWSAESEDAPPRPSRGPPRASTRRAAKQPLATKKKISTKQSDMTGGLVKKTRRTRVSSEQPEGSMRKTLQQAASEEIEEEYDYGMDGVYHEPDWETDYGEMEVPRVRKVRKVESGEKEDAEPKKRRKAKRRKKPSSKKSSSPESKSQEEPVDDDDDDEDSAMDKALDMLTGGK